MKKHGIYDFVPDFPKGKKAGKNMVVNGDLTPLMGQICRDNMEMAKKLGWLEAQLEMMRNQSMVEIDPSDIGSLENEDENHTG